MQGIEQSREHTLVDRPNVLVQGADPHATMVGTELAGVGGLRLVDEPASAAVIVLVEPTDVHWDRAHDLRRPIVLLTVAPLGADMMLAAVMRGADAVIDASAGAEELASAIRTVVRGGVVLSAEFTRRLADALRTAATDDHPIGLSRRERQILECIDAGKSVKETADTLTITPKTVENLQTRLYKKLGVRNRNQALALARALGILGN